MTFTPRWLPARRYWQAGLHPPHKDWVLSRGSLTAALVTLSQHHFQVNVLHQGWHKPQRDESLALGLPPYQRAWVREVALEGHGVCWVQARSIIPVHTLRGKGRRLRFLGSRSLGSLLFKGGQRGAMTLRSPNRQHDDWARRSCFYYGGQPLLVQESFLPALFEAVAQQPNPRPSV